MGGMGSGNRFQSGATTTEQYRAIDIRWLKREGMLTPGTTRNITWSRGGTVTGSISITSEPERVILSYSYRAPGRDWTPVTQTVGLDSTPCHKGGARSWFRCPAPRCGRRVAILYGGAIFACRHCHRLAYPSQREDVADRTARQADRIRARLGWPPGILNGTDLGRPKGMHRRTYTRLLAEHDALVMTSMTGLLEKFGKTLSD